LSSRNSTFSPNSDFKIPSFKCVRLDIYNSETTGLCIFIANHYNFSYIDCNHADGLHLDTNRLDTSHLQCLNNGKPLDWCSWWCPIKCSNGTLPNHANHSSCEITGIYLHSSIHAIKAIFNVYRYPSTQTLFFFNDLFSLAASIKYALMLRDFNVHYSAWNRVDQTGNYEAVET